MQYRQLVDDHLLEGDEQRAPRALVGGEVLQGVVKAARELLCAEGVVLLGHLAAEQVGERPAEPPFRLAQDRARARDDGDDRQPVVEAVGVDQRHRLVTRRGYGRAAARAVQGTDGFLRGLQGALLDGAAQPLHLLHGVEALGLHAVGGSVACHLEQVLARALEDAAEAGAEEAGEGLAATRQHTVTVEVLPEQPDRSPVVDRVRDKREIARV